MGHPDELEGALDPQQLARLRQIENAFGRAWQSGQAPDLDAFLPPRGDAIRRPALFCLIRLDLEERWRRNLAVLIENYLDRYEELGQAQDLPARLLAEEYRFRHRFGDRPPLASYQRRFRSQFTELQQLLHGDEFPTLTPAPHTPAPVQQPKAPSPPPAQPISPEIRLIEQIGRGSYGVVWRAEGPGGFSAAMKVIYRPAGHEDVTRELQVLEVIKRLRHPFLLATIAYWELAGLEIAMELADSDLHKRLQQCKSQSLTGIPVEELIGYFRDAAEAIDYLHKNKVLHRDIKPANLLLLQDRVKVADFGLVRDFPADDMGQATFCGTPVYMAPEVWEHRISPASDLYSLAVTYAELRLGRRLLAGRSLSEIEQEHRKSSPALDPLGLAEQRVLLKALAKRPEERFASCKVFVAELTAVFNPPASQTKEMPDSAVLGETARAPAGWKPPGLPIEPSEWSRQFGSTTVPSSTRPAQRRPFLRTGLTVLGLALVLFLAWLIVAGRPGSFTLEVPDKVLLGQGKTASVSLTVRRRDLDRPISLTVTGLPSGVTLEEHTLNPEDGETVELPIEAERFANAGRVRVQLSGESGNLSDSTSFFLTVIPLPRNCEPDGEETVEDNSDRVYYKRLVCERDPSEPPLKFVVVERGKIGKDKVDVPGTFYIMRDKVSVAEFRRFADAHKSALLSENWNSSDDPDCPAVRVWGVDAFKFATSWITRGQLPTVDQWEKAAGEFAGEEREGPYLGKWGVDLYGKIAVSPKDPPLTRPMKREQASADVSIYGCRDMSGNGHEWTRNIDDSKNLVNDTILEQLNLIVKIRGMDYQGPRPYQFKGGEDNPAKGILNFRETPRLNIGFRVVLESDSWMP